MSSKDGATRHANQPIAYQIRLQGHLSSQWAEWFEGLTITLEEDGNTLLAGPVIDQAALHGILKKVRDLGMPLLAVHALGFDPQNISSVEFLDGKDRPAGDT